MEILWWLAPAAVVAALAMAWVGWLGREGRGEVDRDVAVARMGEALRTQHQGLNRPVPGTTRRPDRSTGVAVRRPRDADENPGRRTA